MFDFFKTKNKTTRTFNPFVWCSGDEKNGKLIYDSFKSLDIPMEITVEDCSNPKNLIFVQPENYTDNLSRQVVATKDPRIKSVVQYSSNFDHIVLNIVTVNTGDYFYITKNPYNYNKRSYIGIVDKIDNFKYERRLYPTVFMQDGSDNTFGNKFNLDDSYISRFYFNIEKDDIFRAATDD